MNYYALLVALILATAFLMHGNRANNKAYVFTACLLLFLIYGLRNTYVIGIDTTTSYVRAFNAIQNRSLGDAFMLGSGFNGFFYALCWFFHLFSHDYQLFITCIAAFVTICFGRLIYRYSPSPLQSILYHFGLLFFTFHFSALKQSLAMALLMPAFDCLVRQKKLKFFLLVLLAGQFHFPALVFLPAYFMSKIKIGRSFLVVLAFLLLITYLFRSQIASLMLNLYRDAEDSSVSVNLSGVTFFRTKSIIMLGIIVAAVIIRKPRPDDRIYTLLLLFMGMALLFQTFCGYNNIFERLADYYFQFSVIFIPMIFDKTADREPLLGWRQMGIIDTIAPYLFCGYGIYRFYTYTLNASQFYPFRFFFEY